MDCILYRAVTPLEFDDIIKQGKKFRCLDSMMGTKQFAITEECGHYYGREVVFKFDKVAYILIKVIVNVNQFCQNIFRLDLCNAVSIDKGDITNFNNAIVELTRIN